MSDALTALRAANPRAAAGFAESVEAAAERVRAPSARGEVEPLPQPRRRFLGISAAGLSLAAAAAIAALVLVGSPGGENATAAFERASTLTAASAERSGTAVIRITHDGRLWAGSTIRWNGRDLALSRGHPSRSGTAATDFLIVDGMMYGIDPVDGAWSEFGSPNSIDPDSGTTPDEYLAAVREDIGGTTLRRFTGAMRGLGTERRDDGSTVYNGTVAAGVIARETGFKEGQAIRVLPFGYVAHDDAANAGARLDVAVTVGPDRVLRRIAVSWGTWNYTVSYSRLGTTAALSAPKDARPFPDRTP
jgi:hypothetical protein